MIGFNRRTVLVGAALLASTTLAHVPALAAKRNQVCNLIADAAGDAKGTGSGVNNPSSDADLDILSADVASNSSTVTGVIRLQAYSTADSTAPFGQWFDVQFSVNDKIAHVKGMVTPIGNSWGPGGKGKGVVDTGKKEVHISVQISDLGVPVPAKAVFKNLKATTGRAFFTTTAVTLGIADQAATDKSYTPGSASCVSVGN